MPLDSLRSPLSLVALLLVSAVGCDDDSPLAQRVSSKAYKGHESDKDANSLVSAYPSVIGTRLDDCQTCHRGGSFTEKGAQRPVFKNACDYCHLIIHPAEGFSEPQPKRYAETLNAFGEAYLEAGRDAAALRRIADEDSDDDGHANAAEIADGKYPGDDKSKPGQRTAPTRALTLAELRALPRHEQFLLVNSSKQQLDNYAHYQGVTLAALLEAVGVDLADGALQGVTVIAPDGYLKDFTGEQITERYPAGLYYAGLDNATLGTECGVVQYPDKLPELTAALISGQPIAGQQRLMLADRRDGLEIDPCNLDISSGRINGEGPLRLVVPQRTPGKPDRGSRFSPTSCDDGYDYDASKDHNAGGMVRGVVAIRVNPLPDGVEDFDHINGGWAFIDSKSVIVYGHGVEPE